MVAGSPCVCTNSWSITPLLLLSKDNETQQSSNGVKTPSMLHVQSMMVKSNVSDRLEQPTALVTRTWYVPEAVAS